MEEDKKEDNMQEKQEVLAPSSSLAFVRDLKGLTRQVGHGLKVNCEVKGSLPLSFAGSEMIHHSKKSQEG